MKQQRAQPAPALLPKHLTTDTYRESSIETDCMLDRHEKVRLRQTETAERRREREAFQPPNHIERERRRERGLQEVLIAHSMTSFLVRGRAVGVGRRVEGGWLGGWRQPWSELPSLLCGDGGLWKYRFPSRRCRRLSSTVSASSAGVTDCAPCTL